MKLTPGRRAVMVGLGTIAILLLVLAIFWLITVIKGDDSDDIDSSMRHLSDQAPAMTQR